MAMGNDQDRTKLHGEINQNVNQRFLLTGTTVAVFALIAKDLFPTATSEKPPDVLKASVLAIVYSVLLCLLFFQSLQLRKVVRTYSTYLIAKEWSEWEEDWALFREKHPKLSRYDLRGHTIVFQVMSLLLFVATLYNAYINATQPCQTLTCQMINDTLVTLAFVGSIVASFFVGWFGWWDRTDENGLLDAWRDMFKIKNAEAAKQKQSELVEVWRLQPVELAEAVANHQKFAEADTPSNPTAE